MIHWANTHGFEILIAYYVLNAIVSSMPDLPPNSGFLATWVYHFLHVFSGNLSKIPALQNIIGSSTVTKSIPQEQGKA